MQAAVSAVCMLILCWSGFAVAGVPSPALSRGLTQEQLITVYFHAGYSYKLIVMFLYTVHRILLSVKQLRRILRDLSLFRTLPQSASQLQLVSHLIRASKF